MATSSRYAMAVPVSEPEVENSVNGSSRLARDRRIRLPPPLPSRGPNLPCGLTFLFEKQLQNSDVNGRIVIPKEMAELHLPRLDAKEGISMQFHDINYITDWTFEFRFWLNKKCRMYVFAKTKSFTAWHGLKKGDFIKVFIDYHTNTYWVRARMNPDDFFHEEMPRPNFALNGRTSATPVIQHPESNPLYDEEEGPSSMVASGGQEEEQQLPHLVLSTSLDDFDEFSHYFN